MGFDASTILGIPIPDGDAARKNLPTHLLAIVDALERYVVQEYANVAEVYTKFPDPDDRPAIIRLPSGAWQYVPAPYDVYAPLGRMKRYAAPIRTTPTPQVTAVGSTFGTTEVGTVGPYPWPHVITVNYRALFNAAVGSDQSEGYVLVDGTPDAFSKVTGDGTATSSLTIVKSDASDLANATELQGGMVKRTGTGTTSCSAGDPRYTKLEWTIAPYLDGIGA